MEFSLLKPTIALAFLSVSSVFAQQIVIDLDPAKTEIHWTLAGNVHTVHGSFHLKQGHIAVDTSSSAVSGQLITDAASGESGNGSRDKRMNKEILESDKFPEVRFTPQKVEGPVALSGHSSVRVSGVFELHGSPHNLTIPMDISISSGALTCTGKFSIPYVDWGIKDPSNFLFKVDKSVDVEIVAVGKLAKIGP